MKDVQFINNIQKIIDNVIRQPERMNAHLDLKIKDASMEEKFAEYIFDVKDWALNPYDGVHGGATCAAFDSAMGITAVALTGRFVSTTDLTVSYLKPMTGKQFLFQIEFTQVGRTMARFTGKAIDTETGVLCATAMSSFVLLEMSAKDMLR